MTVLLCITMDCFHPSKTEAVVYFPAETHDTEDCYNLHLVRTIVEGVH